MRSFVFRLTISLTILLSIQTITRAAGAPDRGFGTNGTVTTSVGASLQAKKVKIQPDGKILVLGAVGSGSAQDTVLARYNADGSADPGFGTNGKITIAFSPSAEDVNDLAFQADGKIILAGSFYSPATQSIDFLVARLNKNGSLDTSFGTNGIATVNQSSTDVFYGVAVQTDNKIVAVGATSQNNYDFAAIRFSENGALDQGFASGGLFFYDLGMFIDNHAFRAVALLQNGRILIGGTANESNGGLDVLVMLEPNGTFAQNFGTNGIVSEFFGTYSAGNNYDLKVLPDGKIQTISAHLFRRLLSNGTQDPGFRNRYFPYISTDNAGTALDVRSDGKIIVLNQGNPGFISNTVLYNPDGRDINFARNLSGKDIVVQSDDKFIVLDALGDSLVLKRFLAITSTGTRLADFDYDEKTDLAILRGSVVQILRTQQGAINYQLNRVPGDVVRIMPEEYSTINLFTLTYWRLPLPQPGSPAYFERLRENSISESSFQWGAFGDIPVGGDYDGESLPNFILRYHKTSEHVIFRPSDGDWWIYNQRTGAVRTIHWGALGDKPVPADYDYDGITDFAIYRPSSGTWWVHRSSNNSYFTLQFGIASDIPLTGDFDGDGRADFTVYRPSEGVWYQYLTTAGFRVTQFGSAADIPVPGDYDGDGKHDIAVYRNGFWYLLQSTDGLSVKEWGTPASGDIPVSVRYDQ